MYRPVATLLVRKEIKSMRVNALVDTGAYMLCINENIQEQLQLPVVEKHKAQMADGSIVEYDVVAPVEIKFKNRRSSVSAMVLPGDCKPKLNLSYLQENQVGIPYLKLL